jgi:hypothetical protein
MGFELAAGRRPWLSEKKPGQQGFQPIIPLIWMEVSISRAELLQMARKRRTGNIQLLANLTDDQTVRAEAGFSTCGRKHSA